MEKQFATLVVLEEGNKGFAALDGACCASALALMI
jgi:hypothetical protein